MTCPDIERLLEAVLGETADPAVQHHLRACPDCRATSRLVSEMRASYRPALLVPEELIERRVGLILETLSPSNAARFRTRFRDAAVSSALALTTALLTIVATGSLGTPGLWGPGLVGVIAMIVAGVYELDVGRRSLHA